jgi:hypothetical protein
MNVRPLGILFIAIGTIVNYTDHEQKRQKIPQ